MELLDIRTDTCLRRAPLFGLCEVDTPVREIAGGARTVGRRGGGLSVTVVELAKKGSLGVVDDVDDGLG